jgi:S-DNA-T family DNA segregation ATPase FtsK/SpoIIIE
MLSLGFLVLSVASYSPNDLNWNYYNSTVGVVHNLGGPLGASLANWGGQLFGSTIALLIGVSGVGAWGLFRMRLGWVIHIMWRGLVVFAVVSATIHLLDLHDPWFGKDVAAFGAGGLGGQWLVNVLEHHLSHTGIMVVMGIATALALGVGSRRGLRALARWSGLLWVLQRLNGIFTAVIGTLRFQDGAQNELAPEAEAVAEAMPVSTRPVVSIVVEDSESDEEGSAAFSAPGALGTHETTGAEEAGEVPGSREFMASCVVEDDVTMGKPLGQVASTRSLQTESVQMGMPISPGLPEDTDWPGALSSPLPIPAAAVEQVQPKGPEPFSPPALLVASEEEAPFVAPSLYSGERMVATPETPPIATGSPSRAQLHPSAPVSRLRETPQRPAASPPPELLTQPRQRQYTAAMLPSLELLDGPVAPHHRLNAETLAPQARLLAQKLREFGVDGEVVEVLPGPVITTYEFAPAAGVKVNKIINLQDDLALGMRALSVRIVAPIPGKAVVGIEIPNARRETVALRELLDTAALHNSPSKLSMALGQDTLGRPVITDLAMIPHLLVAGATGSGKSVGLNSLICSLLFRVTPAEVRLLMIDPKMLEFSIYDGIPHLLIPVVTDAKKAAIALRRVVEEMERRYQLLAAKGVRNITQYNQLVAQEIRAGGAPQPSAAEDDEPLPRAEPLPYLVVIIDELADLMMVSSREVEDSLMRIAQMARAAGIHLIVATQRPSVDVLTGVIKANFPARLSFRVTSKTDSRTILDTNGAETLLGRGDMLFLAPGTSKPQRIHGAYVSESEINRLVDAWKAVESTHYDEGFLEPAADKVDIEDDEYDEKYDEAVALVVKLGQASISMLQRRLRVGYNRAARMIEIMERDGVVGPADGVKPRVVLVRNQFEDEEA